MKRKIDLVDEQQESEDGENEGSSASDVLHSMAASKDIVFWTPSGQLLRNKRTIPVTNIAELVDYVLLPHNNEVTKPRALNTFLDGLAELGSR